MVLWRATDVFPEPMYGFFTALAFYFLYKDNHRFGKHLYMSVVAFGFAVSTKIMAAPFGIAYLIYFARNYSQLKISVVLKSASLGFISLCILNFCEHNH